MKTYFETPRSSLNAAVLLAGLLSATAAETPPPAPLVHDLASLQDATRVLINPHKGWYHHFPDNHPNKYQIARDADLLQAYSRRVGVKSRTVSFRRDAGRDNGWGSRPWHA